MYKAVNFSKITVRIAELSECHPGCTPELKEKIMVHQALNYISVPGQIACHYLPFLISIDS